MKRIFAAAIAAAMLVSLSACGAQEGEEAGQEAAAQSWENAVEIGLSDKGITVDGQPAGTDDQAAVYLSNDIVYYEQGKDFTYGEGTEADAHSPEEAAAHTVVNITRPGTYVLGGGMSAGQVAVDLGEEAKDDPEAVVTLVLNGADISCSVAPAVIFYNVYECGSDDAETAVKDVDTSAAGANIILADGTENNVSGSYVARIYKPDSVELTEDGTEVADAKKLHKYDGAFYSKMSMNVNGGPEGSGVLNITAENEGLDSELHLTVNGGRINIRSGNDGINTNEDYVSVTTVNGGVLNIQVTGETGEGDGIDSNGWLVFNGGTVIAAACASSADSGIDADMGIHINGGNVIATGHMLDAIEEGGQTYAVFQFADTREAGERLELRDPQGEALVSHTAANAFSNLIISTQVLQEGEHTLWSGEEQLAHSGAQGGMMPGGHRPGGMERPEDMGPGMMPGGTEPPEGMQPPEGMDPGELPADFQGGQRPMQPADFRVNEDGTVTLPDGTAVDPGTLHPDRGMGGGGGMAAPEETAFVIRAGANHFSGISEAVQ